LVPSDVHNCEQTQFPKRSVMFVEYWAFDVITKLLWLYGPCRAFASLTMLAHSVPSFAMRLRLLTPIVLKSASTSSSHLSLGLPVLLPPPGFPSNSF
jgi:hypothetical protein